MKQNLRLKFYVVITFLVFTLPFYDACSDKKESEETIETSIDSKTEKTEVENSKIENKNEEVQSNSDDIKKENYFERKKTSVYTAYELVYAFYFNENEEISDFFQDKTIYISIIILLIMIIALIKLVFVFLNQYQKVFQLGIINLILAIIWFIYLFVFEMIEDIQQVKYGFYIYVVVLLLIIFESRKMIKNTE